MVIHFISVLNILCQSRDQTSRRRYSVLSPSVIGWSGAALYRDLIFCR